MIDATDKTALILRVLIATRGHSAETADQNQASQKRGLIFDLQCLILCFPSALINLKFAMLRFYTYYSPVFSQFEGCAFLAYKCEWGPFFSYFP